MRLPYDRRIVQVLVVATLHAARMTEEEGIERYYKAAVQEAIDFWQLPPLPWATLVPDRSSKWIDDRPLTLREKARAEEIRIERETK